MDDVTTLTMLRRIVRACWGEYSEVLSETHRALSALLFSISLRPDTDTYRSTPGQRSEPLSIRLLPRVERRAVKVCRFYNA